jgi:steroid delta-isomerase-like uncharacterized protein
VRKGRNREVAGAAVALAAAGVVTGAAVGGAVARRRRRAATSATHDAEIARRVLEDPWRGSLDVIDELVAPSDAGDSTDAPGQGSAGMRHVVERYLDAFPDASLTVDDQVREGNRVVSRWTARGTHTGELAGIAATGKQVTVSGVTIVQVEGGKVVDGWTSWDRLGLLVQLGAVSEPAHA